MNIKPNRRNSDDEKRFVTGDLPIVATNVSLYKRSTGDYVIRKFGKEFPELYVGIDYLAKEIDRTRVKTIIIREGGSGYVPTLLAIAFPKIIISVSLWLAEYALLERNFEFNVDRWIKVSVERKTSSEADICVLVHEPYQSQASVVEEVTNLLNHSSRGILYMVSHKSKGSETVTELISKSTGILGEVVARGKGGVRVIKFQRTKKEITFKPEVNSYTTVVKSKSLILETGSDAFSKSGVDEGSKMLVRFLSSQKIQPHSIWDLGCGTGYIGIAACIIYSNSLVVLSDVNARIVDAAKKNVANNGLQNRVKIVLSNGATNVQGEFDLILSNPPLHIPKKQLVTILTQARRKLKKGGKMFLVIEDSRVQELRDLLAPIIGIPKIAYNGGSHEILEISK